jgi:hypothetical protein
LFGPYAAFRINLESISIDQSIVGIIVVIVAMGGYNVVIITHTMVGYNVLIIMHTMVGYRFMACVDCMFI